MDYIKLAIILINYKMENLTIKFVKEELSKITFPHLTIIVNNGATDESNRVLSSSLSARIITDIDNCSISNNDIYILSSIENLGFARGNNLGANFCRRHFNLKYILFTNNDIKIFSVDVVERLIEKLENMPNVGIIGPSVIGLDGKKQSPYPYISFWDRMVWMYWSTLFYSKEQKNRKFHFDYPENAQEGFHYYVMGSFFILRIDDFFNCGMFDPNTFLYAEELILSERMAAIEKQVYYYPAVKVIHAHGSTTSKHGYGKSNDWKFDSLMYYYKTYRHVGNASLLIGRLTHWLMKICKF